MALAKEVNAGDSKLVQEFNDTYREEHVNEFSEWKKELRENNPEDFEEYLENFLEKKLKAYIKKKSGKSLEGNYGFKTDSEQGQDYIKDLNFCLEFALENRKRMIERAWKEICFYVNEEKKDDIALPFDELEGKGEFINRNHNHAELSDEGLWIHRKGATHAEKGMLGVIPGNMRDGSFVVEGQGHSDSLNSSSHGAGRVLSRTAAKNSIDLDDFKETMEGITAKVTEKTKDESPFAYKDIFEVMELQKDLVSVKYYLKPIINIKG